MSSDVEKRFQADVVKRLRRMFSGCVILKNDPDYLQGVPDLLVLHGDKWAALECKSDPAASFQPNQEYYIGKMKGMSYAAVIHPQNRELVLNDLQQAFGARRAARLPRTQ